MSTKPYRSLRTALAGIAALGASAFAGNAFAAGTDAGSTVSNSFTLDYSVGGVPQTQITPPAPTDFTVDRLVDVVVTSQGDTNVSPGQLNDGGADQDPELVFAVRNDGNDNQRYEFTLEDPTDDFDATTLEIEYYRDTNGNGTFEPGTDTLVGTLASSAPSADVAPDETVFVVVSGDIPGGATDGQRDEITLVANSLNPGTSLDPNYSATPDTETVADTGGNNLGGEAENVLADADGPGAADGATDGAHSDTGAFVIQAANLSAVKSVAVIATDGGAIDCANDPVVAGDQYTTPGACVEYVITVTNTGAANATDIALADILPNEVTFVAHSQTVFTGGALATTDTAAPTPNPITCDVNTVDCVVRLTGATLASGSVATPTIGTVVIRALVE